MWHFSRIVGTGLLVAFSSGAAADDKAAGHLHPLPQELLADPVELNCGSVIDEWRGSKIEQERVNALCTLAADAFHGFALREGYEIPIGYQFSYRLSFLPSGTGYRNLHDTTWRFNHRSGSDGRTGFTLLNDKRAFILSDTEDPDFEVTVVHELFHAMSFESGFVYSHRPSPERDIPRRRTLRWKLHKNELLAREFTDMLGLGR